MNFVFHFLGEFVSQLHSSCVANSIYLYKSFIKNSGSQKFLVFGIINFFLGWGMTYLITYKIRFYNKNIALYYIQLSADIKIKNYKIKTRRPELTEHDFSVYDWKLVLIQRILIGFEAIHTGNSFTQKIPPKFNAQVLI